MLADETTDTAHDISPGTRWAAGEGEALRFFVHQSTRRIGALTPPFTGTETGFVGDQ